MGNRNAVDLNLESSFLFSWIMANIVGLPILFGPYSVGIIVFLLVAMLSDGGSPPSRWYIFSFMILAVCGAVMGAYLGHMQSFPLKTRLPHITQWIWATAVGVAIGAPVSWLAYTEILNSPLFADPDSRLFFVYSWSQFLIFEILLGLSIGAAQWFVLKQHVHRAGYWIIIWPILLTGGIALTRLRFLYVQLLRSIQQLVQTIVDPSFEIQLPVFVNFLFLFIIPSLIALATVGLISGVILEWLLQSQQK